MEQTNYREIFESIPTSLIIVNKEGVIVYANSQSENLFGYNRNDLTGVDIEILIPNRFRKRHRNYLKQFFSNPVARPMGEGRDLFALDINGREFPVEIALTPLNKMNTRSTLITVIDISYRKEIENTIKESEAKLQAIIDNSPDAIFIYREKGEIVRINKEAGRLLHGNSKIKKIWDIIPRGKRDLFTELLNSVKAGRKILDWESEVQIPGKKNLPASMGLYFVSEKEGLFVHSIRDISDRVNLRNRIMEYEKNKIIAKMSEGIAHHMGTPLASMLLRTQMLKEDLSEMLTDTSHIAKLESIEKQILYGQKIMLKLLKFASRSFDEKKQINLSSVISDALDILQPILSKTAIEIEYNRQYDFTVFADIDMLKLVFSDLLMNATDAMPDGGKITIDIRKHGTHEDKLFIRIADMGTGISEDVLANVFEPFFTTKPAGKGTGLGLSVAKNIITDHNGQIFIESTVGYGTTVNIILPSEW